MARHAIVVARGAATAACTCAISALANCAWAGTGGCASGVWLGRFAVGYAAVLPFVLVLALATRRRA